MGLIEFVSRNLVIVVIDLDLGFPGGLCTLEGYADERSCFLSGSGEECSTKRPIPVGLLIGRLVDEVAKDCEVNAPSLGKHVDVVICFLIE